MMKMLLLLMISGWSLIPSLTAQSLSQGVAKLSLALSANLGNHIALEIIWLILEFYSGNLVIFMSKPWKTGGDIGKCINKFKIFIVL